MSGLFGLLSFGSLVALVIGLIKPSVFRNKRWQNPTRKKVGLVFGGAMLLFFILVGATTSSSTPNSQTNPTNSPTPKQETKSVPSTTSATSSPTPRTTNTPIPSIAPILGGLWVSRNVYIQTLQGVEPDLTFVYINQTQNMDTYGAKQGNDFILLIGPENNLVEIASQIDTSGTTTADDLKLLNEVGGAVDIKSYTWIEQALVKGVNQTQTNPTYETSSTINGRLYTLSFNNTKKIIILTVQVAK